MAGFLAALAIQLSWLAFVAQSTCSVVLHNAMNDRFGEAARQRRAAPDRRLRAVLKLPSQNLQFPAKVQDLLGSGFALDWVDLPS